MFYIKKKERKGKTQHNIYIYPFWPHKFGFKPLLGLEPLAPIRPQLLVSHANHSATETSHVSKYVCMYVCMYRGGGGGGGGIKETFENLLLITFLSGTSNSVFTRSLSMCKASFSSFPDTNQLPRKGKEMFYLTTHSTHFIYGYMASDRWLRTILIVRKETRCRHIGYSFRLAARVLLYASSHRQDNTYHGLCYTSRGALAATRNSSMGSPHEGSIR